MENAIWKITVGKYLFKSEAHENEINSGLVIIRTSP
jgi:hypothetical protein